MVKADVDAAIAGGGAKPAAKAAPAGAPAAAPAAPVKAMSDEQVLKLFEAGSYELVPHDNMRKTIARARSRPNHHPHFHWLDCELDALYAAHAGQCRGPKRRPEG